MGGSAFWGGGQDGGGVRGRSQVLLQAMRPSRWAQERGGGAEVSPVPPGRV